MDLVRVASEHDPFGDDATGRRKEGCTGSDELQFGIRFGMSSRYALREVFYGILRLRGSCTLEI